MHGNQWVLKIAVLKYYSVSKRGTTAKSNPKQATDPISLHTKFGDNSSNTFPLNERKPCVTPDIGRRTPDIGQRTSDIGHRTAKKAKIIYPPPRGVDIKNNHLLFHQEIHLHTANTLHIASTAIFDSNTTKYNDEIQISRFLTTNIDTGTCFSVYIITICVCTQHC